MEDIKELCKLINSMKMVQSLKVETHYNVIYQLEQKNMVIVFSPSFGDFYYQNLLKVTFYNVYKCNIDFMDMAGNGMTNINIKHDDSCYWSGWENSGYICWNAHENFEFRFCGVKYEWIQKEITFDEEQGYVGRYRGEFK